MISSLLRDVTCVVALSMMLVAAGEAWSQELTPEQQSQLSQLLQQNDPDAFAAQAQSFWQSVRQDLDAATASEVQQTLGGRAKQWLEDADTVKSLHMDQARVLGQFAAYGLSPNEKELLAEQVKSTFSNPAATTFEQLETCVTLLGGLLPKGNDTRREKQEFVDQWIEAHDLSDLTQGQLNTCFPYARSVITGEGGFRVTWTGFLTPPNSGSYKFSVSPWNVNMENWELGTDRFNRQTMTVRVNDQLIVNATPDAWNYEGAAIELTGGQRVPIRVEFTYERNDDRRLCPAILYWQGPGVAKSVVPKSVLSSDESGTAGLQAEYTWKELSPEGQTSQIIEKIVDPNVEFVWLDGLTIAAHSNAMQKLATELVSRWTQPDGDCAGDLARRPQLTAILTTSQLAACLEALVAKPERLANIDQTRMWRFYYAVRCGAEEEAIDVLGTWMTQHKDSAPQFAPSTDDFYFLNWKLYRRFAEYMTFENPQTSQWLQQRYLETEDGQCALPVAYTLAYCHLMRGSIQEWIQLLDSQLADESLEGDKRVNWLLARTMAEEIRRGPANRYMRLRELLLVNPEWLDEAKLVANSPDMNNRVTKERTARLAALQLWEAAQAELTAAGLAEEIQTLESLQDLSTQRSREAEIASQNAYVAELKRRQEQAADRGDTAASERYDSLIGNLGNEME